MPKDAAGIEWIEAGVVGWGPYVAAFTLQATGTLLDASRLVDRPPVGWDLFLVGGGLIMVGTLIFWVSFGARYWSMSNNRWIGLTRERLLWIGFGTYHEFPWASLGWTGPNRLRELKSAPATTWFRPLLMVTGAQADRIRSYLAETVEPTDGERSEGPDEGGLPEWETIYNPRTTGEPDAGTPLR